MNYFVGVFGVLLLHLLATGITIAASTGNGSFVGLGAMLLAVWGIPTTLIANFLLIRSYRTNPRGSRIVQLIVLSCILPVLQLLLLAAQIVFRL
jgi:hypothetical protein